MTLFVINIGKTGYSNLTIPLIKRLCDYNKINLFVLEDNISHNKFNLHPSWLKLFCHKLVKDDFIVCWDLDLVPVKLYDIINFFDFTKINLCYDYSLIKNNKIVNYGFNGKFKYNCGLIGIPKEYSDFFESIYHDKGLNSSYPSYEQYHVNDKIYDNKIQVNVLDQTLNRFYDGSEYSPSTLNVHYTWKIKSNLHRIELINNHFKTYAKNFQV